MLQSLGGTKLLIPILENTSLPLTGETDNNAVSLFLQLLQAFLDEHNQNLFLLNDGIAIVGALMEEVIYCCYSNMYMHHMSKINVINAQKYKMYLQIHTAM